MWIVENPQEDTGIAVLGVLCLRSMPLNSVEWSGNRHFVTVLYLWLGKELDPRVQWEALPHQAYLHISNVTIRCVEYICSTRYP